MKFKLKSSRLSLLDISIDPQHNFKDEEFEIKVNRGKYVGANKNTKKIVAIKVKSNYQITVAGRVNSLNFDSVIEVLSDIPTEEYKSFKNTEVDSVFDSILWAHEIGIVKMILESFGVNVTRGLPLGMEFDVAV